MKTEEKIGNIDWEIFSDKYVRFEDGEPKDLVLSNWRQITKEWAGEEKEGIEFDVVEEDGKACNKILSRTSRRLINSLRPIIELAEKMKDNSIKVRIIRTGEGKKTQYTVKTLK